jgi:hypothetical protein
MSYDPSQAIGTRGIQIDINSSTILSDDITQHTETSINAKNIYFIDVRHYFITSASVISYRNFNGFLPFGGQFKGRNNSSGSTACDESYCGVNSRNTALTVFVNTSGSPASITTNNSFKSFWRIN